MEDDSEINNLPPGLKELVMNWYRENSSSSSSQPNELEKKGLAALVEKQEALVLQQQYPRTAIRHYTMGRTLNHHHHQPILSQESRNVTDHSKNCDLTSVSVSPKDEDMFYSLSLEEPKKDKNLPVPSVGQSRKEMGLMSSNLQEPRRPIPSSHLLALNELEFRKAFLILSYCGKKKLEDVITVDTIKRMTNFPITLFETEIWRILGYKCIEETDRVKNLDWDSGKTHVYHCHADSDGSYFFKGPYLQKEKTHLQRVLGDENVLLVKFAEIEAENNYAVYRKLWKEGIFVGLRRYQFFVFKDGGKEQKKKSSTSSTVKCYFVCMDSPCILFNKPIFEARSLFMHIHKVSTVAKYMARFSLILSKTIKPDIDLGSVNVERIEDLPCLDNSGRIVYNEDGEARIHTDGTGYISEDLALKCPRNISKGKIFSQGDLERFLDRIASEEKSSEFNQSRFHIGEPPLLIQFRLFHNGIAVKGTLLINKKLPPNTIQIRPSMIKVERDQELLDAQTANSLEIVSTSNKPRKPFLSKYLLALLAYGGVPTEYFMDVLKNALEDAKNVHYDKRAALTVASKYGDMDDFLVSRMILCGIPIDEPYLQDRLSILMREEKKSLKEGKLPVSECYYLMGTTDPTGILDRNQVCVILEDGQISGDVLVYKNPGLHFGDIHVLKATYVKELEDFVGNAKYAIFFPTKGPRSLADEIANSDFDGDMYWVSRNPQLVHWFKSSTPWTQTYVTKSACHRQPRQFSSEELEDELFQQFLTKRFNPSKVAGAASDSWMAYMDRLLTLGDACANEKECMKAKMLQLTDIYYDALDAPKTGKKVVVPTNLKVSRVPHFLERSNINCYHSTSVLGKIFDEVESFKDTTRREPKEVWKLPCFSSGEIPASCFNVWKGRYDNYRIEMSDALRLDDSVKEEAANEVILKYKQMLYNAPELNQSIKNKEEIYNEALAIYHVAYDYAKLTGVGKCGFAWKVAGQALCEIFMKKQEKIPIICSKSVLREILN